MVNPTKKTHTDESVSDLLIVSFFALIAFTLILLIGVF